MSTDLGFPAVGAQRRARARVGHAAHDEVMLICPSHPLLRIFGRAAFVDPPPESDFQRIEVHGLLGRIGNLDVPPFRVLLNLRTWSPIGPGEAPFRSGSRPARYSPSSHRTPADLSTTWCPYVPNGTSTRSLGVLEGATSLPSHTSAPRAASCSLTQRFAVRATPGSPRRASASRIVGTYKFFIVNSAPFAAEHTRTRDHALEISAAVALTLG